MVQIVLGDELIGLPMSRAQAETILKDKGWEDDSSNSSGSWKKRVDDTTMYLHLKPLKRPRPLSELP